MHPDACEFETKKEKEKTPSAALKAANELAGEALKRKPTAENGLLAAQISVLSIIACELHEIGKALSLLNKEK